MKNLFIAVPLFFVFLSILGGCATFHNNELSSGNKPFATVTKDSQTIGGELVTSVQTQETSVNKFAGQTQSADQGIDALASGTSGILALISSFSDVTAGRVVGVSGLALSTIYNLIKIGQDGNSNPTNSGSFVSDCDAEIAKWAQSAQDCPALVTFENDVIAINKKYNEQYHIAIPTDLCQ
jgi:hypothetical protein